MLLWILFILTIFSTKVCAGPPGESTLVVGFGIRGDVLAIENTFSLLAGWSLKLCRFVELGSLLVIGGWELKTCSMPSVHTITSGCVLNKQVSCADASWGKTWLKISRELRV